MNRTIAAMGATPLLAASALLCGTASAADIRLSGSDTVLWDFSTANWLDDSGNAVKYADGDNVMIGSDFTGGAVTLNAWLNPGDVTFDVADSQEIVLGASSGSNAFGGNTKSITKRGAGTLRVKSMWNYSACDWHVYGGLLTTVDEWIGDNNTFGNTAKDWTIHVYDGATLENPNNKALGYSGDTATDEDHAVNVTVHSGGTFRPGQTGTYGYPFSTVKDLTFDGGAFDFTKKGYWGQGLLKVTRKLAFAGSSAYTLNRPNGNAGKIAFASSRQTAIDVADITGDDKTDLTISTENVGRMTEAAVVGVKKTGAGTLLWSGKIYNSYNRGDWVGWLGLNGKITVAEGKMVLSNPANAMEGDLEVTGGELWLGADAGKFVPTNAATATTKTIATTATYAGNLQVEGREIVASGTGKLVLPQLYMFGGDPDLERDWPNDAVTFVARDSGEIHIDIPGTTAAYRGVATFPNLRLEGNGKLVVNGTGYWSKGAVCVLGTFGFGGTTPVTVAANHAQSDMMSVNADSTTTFDVPDITNDGETDVFFNLPIGRTKAQGEANKVIGFRKSGAGTLCLSYVTSGLGAAGMSGLNGTLTVDAGALQYACDLRDMTFAVATGAYLQPCAAEQTYRVANVTVAEGGGFRVKAGDAGAILVTGALTLPQAGIVDIAATDEAAAQDLKMTFLTVADGAEVSAPDDFSGWTVTVNGQKPAEGAWKVVRKGNAFTVKPVRGLCVIVK